MLCDTYTPSGSVQCVGLNACAGSAAGTYDEGYCYASTVWAETHTSTQYRDFALNSGVLGVEYKTTPGFAASVRCLSGFALAAAISGRLYA